MIECLLTTVTDCSAAANGGALSNAGIIFEFHLLVKTGGAVPVGCMWPKNDRWSNQRRGVGLGRLLCLHTLRYWPGAVALTELAGWRCSLDGLGQLVGPGGGRLPIEMPVVVPQVFELHQFNVAVGHAHVDCARHPVARGKFTWCA